MPLVEVRIDKKMHVVHEEPRPANTASVAPTVHRSSSVLLQGNGQTSVSNLFLFPGAIGTSEVFEPIPTIDPNRMAVFGLTTAFANVPEQFTNRRQPHGP